MQRPDLDRMWETFVRVSPGENPIGTIRSKIHPLISRLKNEGIIGWYHFLVHDRRSGVPTSEDDASLYFHLRFEFGGADPSKVLPDYCVMTRKTGRIESITGIDKSLLKEERIEEAWRVIGEQSEWAIDLLNTYKEDVQIPLSQIMQFLHYFFNMMQLGVYCPNCKKLIPL